jgi:hypothetical protein
VASVRIGTAGKAYHIEDLDQIVQADMALDRPVTTHVV